MILVLGTLNPVVLSLISRLLEGGNKVGTIAPSRGHLLPSGVELVQGEPSHIDFGVSGEDYSRLCREVTGVYLAEVDPGPASDIEQSRIVRLAVEIAEFVEAGGAPEGVTFLSSLLVFGNQQVTVSEDEFELGQDFADDYEHSLALAEKVVRRVQGRCPLGIVRSAPIIGSGATLLEKSQLAVLARVVDAAPDDFDQVFSDLPVRLETAEHAASALLALPRSRLAVAHLALAEPLTDRELVEWLAERRGKRVHEVRGGARPLAAWLRPSIMGARVVRGWALQFGSENAEQHFPELLERDEIKLLENLFPVSEGASLEVR